jgi:protein TonB
MKKWQLRHSLIASLLLHTLFMLSSFVLPKLLQPLKHEVIEVTYQEPPLPEKPKDLSKLPPDPLQVVEQSEHAINDEKSDEAKFLSAHNQVVKKQTVATQLGDFRNREAKENFQGQSGKPKLNLQDLKPEMNLEKMVEKKQQQERELEKTLDEDALKQAFEKTKPQKQVQTNPRNETPGTAGAEASQTTDYLKDLDKGMETLLSTREFVYYTFYARIRRQLNQHWGGKVREKLAKIVKEGRSIASSEDKVTKLLITLDRVGHLVKVQVVGDSGVRDLDQAAIEAFQEAAPFPNPPTGIIEPDGTIKIRWDFILEA